MHATFLATHTQTVSLAREYLRDLLSQVLDSYRTISTLQDKPGDLVTMRTELLKARGIMQVISNRIDARDYPSVDISGLVHRISHFITNYSFEREMDIMEPLYGEDPGRLRHMRFKILEAFEDKSMPDKISEILEGL